MEAVRSSEVLVTTYKATQHPNPDNYHWCLHVTFIDGRKMYNEGYHLVA